MRSLLVVSLSVADAGIVDKPELVS